METNYIKLPIINYHLYQANNGIKLLLIPNNDATIISYGTYINVGSLDENDDELGIAHFLEHMMFKGSKKYPGKSLINKLDELGTSYNATTSFEYTEYEIHGLPQFHDELLTILLDMYFNPLIPSEDVEIERQIINEEYNMRYDSKHLRQYLNLLKLVTQEKNKLYSRPIIGTKESINKITGEDLMKFRKNKYMHNKTIITISGNINIEYTLNHIIKTIYELTTANIVFDKLNYKHNELINYDDDLFFDTKNDIYLNNRFIYEKYPAEQTIITMSFPCWRNFNKNNHFIAVISSLLTDGMSGRITKALREDNGLSYSQNSYLDTYSNFGLFNISVGVNNEKIFDALITIVNVLIEMFKNGINEQELVKVKNLKLTGLMIYFQKQLSYFNYFTETIINDAKIETLDDIVDKFNDFNVDKINEIIKKVINPKQMLISIIGPKKPKNSKMIKLFNYFNKKIKN
jgi:predicted Zn-dependent peptidase